MNISTNTPCRRFRLLLLCAALTFASACGDSSSAPSTPNAIPFTVFVPVGSPGDLFRDSAKFAALDYRVTCDVDLEEAPPVQQATLEARDAHYGDPAILADVWRGFVQADPGECVITFQGLAEDGQSQCVGSNSLNITEDTSALYYNMYYCLQSCPQVDLPDTDAARKSSCLPRTGLLLSAATPIELETAVAVQYALRPANIPGASGAWEGTLEPQSLGSADFGQGPVETTNWESTVGLLDWPDWDLELTAVDAQGIPLCQTNTRIKLVWNIANKVHIVMPCSP